jgi:hypothetical protein
MKLMSSPDPDPERFMIHVAFTGTLEKRMKKVQVQGTYSLPLGISLVLLKRVIRYTVRCVGFRVKVTHSNSYVYV